MQFSVIWIVRRSESDRRLPRDRSFPQLAKRSASSRCASDVGGREFQCCLEFRDRVIFLSLGIEHATELEMNAGVIWAFGRQLAQQGLGIAEAARLHVNIGEADGSFGGVRIERQHLLVLRFRGGEFFSPLVQQVRQRDEVRDLWA